MKRETYTVIVTDASTEQEIGRAEKFAHNSAIGAGEAIIRGITRPGEFYERHPFIKSPTQTVLGYKSTRSGRALFLTIIRPTGEENS